MQPNLKKILRALSLDIRHTLEGTYDNSGAFHPGDLETRLNGLGVWRERPAKPLDELGYLSAEDKAARQVIDAYIAYRAEAGVERADAVSEFVRESAYNWANRLLALRCMEARGIIDEVILQKEIYGGRSLVHNRLARKNPEACAGADEGLFVMLFQEFEGRAKELPELFAPASPAIALRPSLPALKRCLALLSGTQKANGQEAASDEVFCAADALGWAYQYWNTEEKDRVFEKVRTQKGAKIEGADIIPATQLYTEPYMVKFLVQNSLGATWMGLHPDSKLAEGWEYYVKDADRAQAEPKPLEEITLLDPACGSGHFLLEAFDMFFQMYTEENRSETGHSELIGGDRELIASSILNHNLYGIDIDERAVQITTAALWMKAKEFAPALLSNDLITFHHHLVATNIRLPKGKNHLKTFLAKHPEAAQLQPALEAIFEGLENVHELGSLVQIEEPVEKELRYLREKYENAIKRGIQTNLFESTKVQGELPLGIENYQEWKTNTLASLEQHFSLEVEASNAIQSFFSEYARKGIALFNLLTKRYDIVTTNPPYMGASNMGEFQKNYLLKHYAEGSNDLFTSFIIRCMKLKQPHGYLGMVTLHSWMFLGSYTPLRKYLLEKSHLEVLVHLGRHAFSEADPPGNAVLFIISEIVKNSNVEKLFAFRMNSSRLSEEQDIVLRYLLETASVEDVELYKKHLIHHTDQKFVRHFEEFSSLPDMVFAYWIPDQIAQLFQGKKVKDYCILANRTKTGNNEKFVRYIWETQELIGKGTNWLIYQKGGDYRTYYGNNNCIIKWSHPYTQYYREDPNCRVTDSEFTCQEALSYNSMGRQFSGRITPDNCTYDVGGAALTGPLEDLLLVNAVLNSQFGSYIIKAINDSINIQSSDVFEVPIPYDNYLIKTEIIKKAQTALKIRKILCSGELTEYNFSKVIDSSEITRLEKEFIDLKNSISNLVCEAFGIEHTAAPFQLPIETNYEFISLEENKDKTKLLKQNILSDRISHLILRYLGHCWPNQIEGGEPLPEWADPDGIIPLTPGLSELPFVMRVRTRLLEEFPGENAATLEREFEEIMGESLEKWLSSSFFKHHISQFKKRPIAWQLSSRPGNGAGGKGKKKGLDKAPAFACLVYYHKLDHNTLTTLQSQYVRPLRQSYETELRTLDNNAFLTPEQSSRRFQLEAWIDELKDFEARLEQCAHEGFASPALAQVAVKEPLDRWTSRDGQATQPANRAEFEAQEMRYDPDINDGVRVNIAPLQKYGLLAADVLDAKDLEKAIADRAEWRADERRWCREGKLPLPGWWKK
jgi:hypothetical protein